MTPLASGQQWPLVTYCRKLRNLPRIDYHFTCPTSNFNFARTKGGVLADCGKVGKVLDHFLGQAKVR